MGGPDSPAAPTKLGGVGARTGPETTIAAAKQQEKGPPNEQAPPLADPTEPGVWRKNKDRHKWTLYSLEIAEIIFTAFAKGEASVEWGSSSLPRKRRRDMEEWDNYVTHRVEFDRMKEVNVATKSERDVVIVQTPITEINYTPSMDPVEAGLWWKHDNGKWHCYPESTQLAFRNAWRRKEHYLVVKSSPSLKSPQGTQYILNLRTMKQMDPVIGHKHPLRMISNLCMPEETLSENENKNLTIISLSCKLMEEALQRLTSREFIQVRLAKMVKDPYKLQAVEENKFLQGDSGSKYSRNEVQRVHEEFRNSIYSIIRTVPGCCGQLLRIVRQTPDSDEAKVPLPNMMAMLRHVFYWAPTSKVTSILRNGLDAVIALKPSDCFRPTSDNFEKLQNIDGLLKLMLFLAVVPKSLQDPSSIAFSAADLVHYLPIAVVTIKSHAEPGHRSGKDDPSEEEQGASSPAPSVFSPGDPEEEKEVPAADFHDFNSYRTENDIAVGQIWALYDDQDGMPRFYGSITQVSFSPFTVNMYWLDPHPSTDENKLWMKSTGLSVTCGEFQITMSCVIKRQVNFFSHKMADSAVNTLVRVYPRKSQVWAIYRDWDKNQSIGPKKILNAHGAGHTYMYEIVEILDDYLEEEGVTIVRLVKVKGFKTVFLHDDDPLATKTFVPSEMRRFSHRVPVERLCGNDQFGIPSGALELDPASTPMDLIFGIPDETI